MENTRVIAVERSMEPCTESGWYGYVLELSAGVDAQLMDALCLLGEPLVIRSLKRPFFTVRAEGFLIRGICGDSFIKVGVAQLGSTRLDEIAAYIELSASR